MKLVVKITAWAISIPTFLFWFLQFIFTFYSLVIHHAFEEVVPLTSANIWTFRIVEANIFVLLILLWLHFSYRLNATYKKIFTYLFALVISFAIFICEIGVSLYVGIGVFTSPEFEHFNPIPIFIANGLIAYSLLRYAKFQSRKFLGAEVV